jgi:hypothetical protein
MSKPDIKSIVAFGKIVFIPTEESVPPLPDMKLLFLNENDRGDVFPWRAACIDLEIDAVGNSMDEAWGNLKNALTMYINMEKKAVGNSIIEVAKRIINTAFAPSSQKEEYVDIYRQAKLLYTINVIEAGKIFNPIEEEKLRLKELEAEKEPIRRYTTNVLQQAA